MYHIYSLAFTLQHRRVIDRVPAVYHYCHCLIYPLRAAHFTVVLPYSSCRPDEGNKHLLDTNDRKTTLGLKSVCTVLKAGPSPYISYSKTFYHLSTENNSSSINYKSTKQQFIVRPDFFYPMV